MIARAFLRALDQLFDPSFRKVFFIGIIGAAAVFAALLFLLVGMMPEGIQISDWEWLNDSLNWIAGFAIYPAYFLVGWFLFPAIATMFMGIFLDDIVDAVEAKHYEGYEAPRRLSAYESFMAAVRMGLMVIFYNLLALPLYVILLFTAVGPFILYVVLNGFLLGREYFELVALRHFSAPEAKRLRRAMRDRAFLGGVVITLLYIVPIVNLAAPLLGAAMMVHIFHRGREDRIQP